MKDVMSFIEATQKINRQFAMNDSITQLLKANEKWTNAFNKQDSIYQMLSQYHGKDSHKNHSLNSITKLLTLQSKLTIPNTAIDAIISLNRQHEEFFKNFRTTTEFWPQSNSAIAQMTSLQFALKTISSQITDIAALNQQWELLEEFEEISGQAIEITSNVTVDTPLTKEESIRFENLIKNVIAFLIRNKKFGVNALMFLSVITSLMAIHQYYDFVKEKPELATKEDLEKFGNKLQQVIESKLKEEKEYRTTNRVCNVLLKPKNKSLVIEILPCDFDLIVLQVNHKWVYVSYTSPSDNLPQTGWIMKKYLNQSK